MLKKWINNRLYNKIVSIQIDNEYELIQKKVDLIEKHFDNENAKEVDDGVRLLSICNLALDYFIKEITKNEN